MMPMNKIAILIIILVVLIALIIILTNTVTIPGQELGNDARLRQCCNQYRANGCPDIFNDIEYDIDIICSDEYSLKELAEKVVGNNVENLRKFCGCK